MKLKTLLLTLSLSCTVTAEPLEDTPASLDTIDSEYLYKYYNGYRSINIALTNVFNGNYKVSARWSPDGGSAGVSGPATVTFSNINDSTVFTIEMTHFRVEGLPKNAAFKGLDKVYQVDYKSIPEDLKPFFFKDLDFNGVDELIAREYKAGQRWHDSLIPYKKQPNGKYTLMTTTPFDEIDSSTKFDPVNKTIEITRSGGACSSEFELYKADEDGKVKSIRLTKYDYIDEDGNHTGCTEYVYENGTIRTRISLENVIKSGVANSYYPDGSKKSELYYVNGTISGVSKGWYNSGTLKGVEVVKNGVRQGYRKTYYESGAKKEVVLYKDGNPIDINMYNEDGSILYSKDYRENGSID
jgi:antitoxin component YwqK of YwqJK toxin-antitoxin module